MPQLRRRVLVKEGVGAGGGSGGERPREHQTLNCLMAKQLCQEDANCSAILKVIPTLCGPELGKEGRPGGMIQRHEKESVRGRQAGSQNEGNGEDKTSENVREGRTSSEVRAGSEKGGDRTE
ncbi:hypothetical protein Pcinc_030062 [Petrolisthes cinctipes]|uniref:Uncharacterized protein n=1 Tax=Petrolisthes cinctipes TaxID=88211 RepID=A0AAE1EZS1_PETCI|nr:hypothetical protein Pcinc_030062 [Petrolisthes cinctipes]